VVELMEHHLCSEQCGGRHHSWDEDSGERKDLLANCFLPEEIVEECPISNSRYSCSSAAVVESSRRRCLILWIDAAGTLVPLSSMSSEQFKGLVCADTKI